MSDRDPPPLSPVIPAAAPGPGGESEPPGDVRREVAEFASDASLTPCFRLRVSARPGSLKGVRGRVAEALRQCGVEGRLAADLVLAVDEACQNVIRHAYDAGGEGEMVVEMRHGPGLWVVRLRDFGHPADPRRIQPRPLGEVRPGGVGTHLMTTIMDRVDYLRPADGVGTLLRMEKRL